nr:CUB and sushi domain-containing protein 3-like isoform X1 [Ciona intestinalis]|eukprot:XP_002124008.1 CUB and sushi domain-containing protein 3-like isoform X1 [Ciona intestinalis]
MTSLLMQFIFNVIILTYFTVNGQGCGNAPTIENAQIATHAGPHVRYECIRGYYVINGTNTLHCINNSWVGIHLTCLQGCPRPDPVQFASIDFYRDIEDVTLNATSSFNGVRKSMTAYYKCNEGYDMRGQRRSRSCQTDFTWTEVLFQCHIKSCPAPPMIDHGIITGDSFRYESWVTYTCDPGYYTDGSGRRPVNIQCIERNGNMQWQTPPPVCKLICSPRNALGVELGRTCMSACETDSDCSVHLESCICDGLCGFSCINPDSICQIPGQLANGTTSYSTINYNSTVLYECFPGYVMASGDAVRKCRSDSVWSGAMPTCVRGCGQPVPLENGGIPIGDAVGYLVNDVVKYTCPAGFSPTGPSNIAVCGSNFQWTTPNLRCVQGNCGPPEVPEHGHTQQSSDTGGSNLLFNQTAYFSCDPGYVLNGTANISCTSNSFGVQFHPPNLPLCERGCTQPLPVTLEGTEATTDAVGSGFAVGSIVTYQCSIGHYIHGAGSRQCSVHFNWTEPGFLCLKMSCDVPVVPVNGSVSGASYLFNDSIQFSCDTGFTMQGSEGANCVWNSTGVMWDSKAPVCNPVACSPPMPPVNGSVENGEEFIYLDEVTYSCDFGFELVEEEPVTRTCLANGTWGDTPVCEVVYDCNFDDPTLPTCGYVNQGWTRQSAIVNGTEQSFVIGIAAFSNAIMTSQAYGPTNESACLSFKYRQSNNMVGGESIKLMLKAMVLNSTQSELWGSSIFPMEWKEVFVTIQPVDVKSKWSFEYSGSGYSLLDDIYLDKSGECDFPTEPTTTMLATEPTTTQSEVAIEPTTAMPRVVQTTAGAAQLRLSSLAALICFICLLMKM